MRLRYLVITILSLFLSAAVHAEDETVQQRAEMLVKRLNEGCAGLEHKDCMVEMKIFFKTYSDAEYLTMGAVDEYMLPKWSDLENSEQGVMVEVYSSYVGGKMSRELAGRQMKITSIKPWFGGIVEVSGEGNFPGDNKTWQMYIDTMSLRIWGLSVSESVFFTIEYGTAPNHLLVYPGTYDQLLKVLHDYTR